MNLSNKMSILALVGAMMMVPLDSFSQGPQGPGRNRGEDGRQHKERRMEVYLDLTDEQQEQAKDIRMSAETAILPISNQVNEIRAKLKTLETAKDVDLKLVNKNIDEVARLNAEIHKVRAKSKQEFRAILTDDQRVKFDTRASSQRTGGHGDRPINRPSGDRN